MTREEIIAGTLKWCNERRKEKGLDPLDDLPKGRLFDGVSCPCGVACGYYVGYVAYFKAVIEDALWRKSKSQEGFGAYAYPNKLGDVPVEVAVFARGFDNGKYPEYVADEDLSRLPPSQ